MAHILRRILNLYQAPHRPLEATVSRAATPTWRETLPPVRADQHGPAMQLAAQPVDIIHHPTLSVAFLANLGSNT